MDAHQVELLPNNSSKWMTFLNEIIYTKEFRNSVRLIIRIVLAISAFIFIEDNISVEISDDKLFNSTNNTEFFE